MDNQHYILGMAGHTDHGKSALVQALTGVDPDRLPEEKARGMTIDLGFAHLELPSHKNTEAKVQLDIVDVPGHASFIKNMVSGVGSIDAVLFAVAADDLWMPQSEEHLQILEYLGIRHGVFALTKADLHTDCSEQIAELRQWLKDSALQDAPIVPTSVVDGKGLPELKIALAKMLANIPVQSDQGKPRLAVDRVFSRQGIGTVVTGTLSGGTFQTGQPVVVQPKILPSRIRTLQMHSLATEKVLPGTRSALSLADVEVAEKGRKGVDRGDVITIAALGEPTDILDVWLTRSDRESIQAQPMKHATKIHFHHGTGQEAATVYLFEGDQLTAGQSCLAQIRLARPMFLFTGDRFLLRDWAKTSTIAGGRILENHANPRHYRDKQRIALLEKKHSVIDCLRELLLISVSQHLALKADQLLKQSNFSDSEIGHTLENLTKTEKLLAMGDFVVDPRWWDDLLTKTETMIDAEHQANPQLQGLAISTLRSNFEAKLPNIGLLESLLDCLTSRGFTQSGNSIGRTTHQPTLPEHLRAAGEKIRESLKSQPLSPPPRKEFAADNASREALAYLISQGEVVPISETLVMTTAGFEQARNSIGRYLQENGSATLAQIRDLLGSSRRIVVPLMEKLDQDRFTVRSGDLRKLK